ncbi:MAG TPA: zf-HC2 domain-containing protein [Candidatus Solibacter sp.]|nr:zf-HC2 domain-containing protein [Candidatus Solibacter sp.]
MKQCWPEGSLRAYLDGELRPEEMRSVEAHLAECLECSRLHTELSVRASYVGGLMESLEIPVAQPARQKPTARATGSWLWTGAAVALAAGLAIAAMLLPKREPVRQVNVAPLPAPGVEEPVVVKEIPAVTPQPRVTNASTAPKARRSRRSDPFIALDDEPIESGIVLRVELPGSTPADIVFSPDGRARAVRLVNGNQRNY